MARRLAGCGTAGTRLGKTDPRMPRAPIKARRTPCSQRSGLTPSGPRKTGSAERASTAPPTGSVAPPENETTPLKPMMIPGVASPWRVSKAAIAVNAVPTSTARPSRRRTPTIVRMIAAAVAAKAARPTPAKWMSAGTAISSGPRKCAAGRGTVARAPASMSTGTSLSLTQRISTCCVRALRRAGRDSSGGVRAGLAVIRPRF